MLVASRLLSLFFFFFFFSSRRRHTRSTRDWSSDVCSSDLEDLGAKPRRDVVADPCRDGLPPPDLRREDRERALHPAPQVRVLLDLRREEIGRASCRERV